MTGFRSPSFAAANIAVIFGVIAILVVAAFLDSHAIWSIR
jgi:hypothetical protein